MDTNELIIRDVTILDGDKIAAIYNYYILHSISTFEEDELTFEEVVNRIQQVTKNYPWLVAELDGELIGYAYANEWKSRSAYRFTAETSIYLKQGCNSKGIGYKLYDALIQKIEKETLLVNLIGGISLPNDSSIRLHEKLGFQKLGQFHQVGWKFNQWVDVGYWEKRLPVKDLKQKKT